MTIFGSRNEKREMAYLCFNLKISGKYIFQSVENIRILIQNININKVAMLHYNRQHF